MAESSGLSFHFFSSWQQCPRKFYFSRIARLVDPPGKGALIGSGLHEALYAHRIGSDARAQLWDYFNDTFPDVEERRDSYARASSWLNSWLNRFAPLESRLKIEPEKELVVDVPDVGRLSCRLDALIHDDELTVEDLKSSSFKDEAQSIEREMQSDQYTQYALLTRLTYGVNPRFRINVAYLKPVLPQAFLSDSFYISIDDQLDYLDGLKRLAGDITETLEAFGAGQPLTRCFPRATGACSTFGCAFEALCRNVRAWDIRDGITAPAGFGISADDRIKLLNPNFGGYTWKNEQDELEPGLELEVDSPSTAP